MTKERLEALMMLLSLSRPDLMFAHTRDLLGPDESEWFLSCAHPEKQIMLFSGPWDDNCEPVHLIITAIEMTFEIDNEAPEQ